MIRPRFFLQLIAIAMGGGFLLRCAAQAPASPQKSPSGSVTAYTNSMQVLDDKRKIAIGDRLSFRVVEDRKPPISLVVMDSGEVEAPLIGRIAAAGKTCKQLAYDMKPSMEKDYFYTATVIVGLEFESGRSLGRIYVTGNVRGQGPQEIPPGEIFTVSKAILRAGGFDQFANKRKVKLVRKKADNPNETETTIVDVEEIIEGGHTEKDPQVNAEDMIIVPRRLFSY